MAKITMEIIETCVVCQSAETPKHNIRLSNLDLIWSGEHTPVLIFYRHNGQANFFDVEMLKPGMAKTLCTFYHLAGRMSVDKDGQHEIRCTGEGVHFVVARCMSTLADFGEFTPSMELRQLFVPSLKAGKIAGIVLMVQVTFFNCGGVCLGIWTDHRAVDGQCMHQFHIAWAKNTQGAEAKVTALSPDRTLLRARSPPTVSCVHSQCRRPKASRTSSLSNTPAEVVVLKLSKDQLESLKDKCRNIAKDSYPSTFVAVSSYVWRCSCKARQLQDHEETRLYIAVDARTRLNPPLPHGFFGNAVVRTSTGVMVAEILSDPIYVTADKISCTIARVDDEYIRSVVDCLELNGNSGCAVNGSFTRSANDLLAVSWMGLPMSDVNFGLGNPAFTRRAELASTGQVYFLPDSKGGITVMAALEPENMARLESFFYEDLVALPCVT